MSDGEEGAAAQHRNHRLSAIRSTTAAAAVAKGITAAVQIALVPITLGYLGQSSYGIWMAISATVAFLQVSDLGIGNALISLTAQERIAGGHKAVVRLLKKGLLIAALIAAFVFFAGLVGIESLSWAELLAIPAGQEVEARQAIVACLFMFCVSMPLTLAQQIRLGLMRGYGNSIFQSIGQLLNLLFVWVGVQNGVSLAALIILATLGVLIGNFSNLMSLLMATEKEGSLPQQANAHVAPSFKSLFKHGLPFLILQVSGLFLYQSDVLIVSHFLGPEKVTDYSVSMKYFSMPILVLSFYLYSVWPAYADAKARGDWVWIRSFYRSSLKKSVAFSSVMGLSFLVASYWALPLWTSGKVNAEPALVVLLALSVGLNALGGNLASFMNGLHMLKLQTALAVIGAVIAFGLSVMWTPKIGLSGPVAATVVTNIVMYAIMFVSVQRKLAGNLIQEKTLL
jgi:O-antigen/teichoic acid export membrane protein